MKRVLDIESWSRKDHFNLFRQFEEPFFGVVAEVDVTHAHQSAKKNGYSFYLTYLHGSLKAANSIENFRYRIENQSVMVYDVIHGSSTIIRPDGTFGFSYIVYEADFALFHENAKKEIERVQKSTGLELKSSNANIIHYSLLPWIRFTGLSHARSYSINDCIPKISFGKITNIQDKKWLPVALHIHHALADGYHVGLFYQRFQDLLYEI